MIYILIVLIAFLAVLLVRAATFKPGADVKQGLDKVVITDKAVEHLSQMIKIPTISSYDKSQMDEKVFTEYRNLLNVLYPNVYTNCKLEMIGHTGMLFHWKGKSNHAPVVLMAHYDVVPVDADKWKHPPFCGEIFNGELWGRGTIDTKITVLGIMEACEAHIKNGFVPENDVYLSFAGDEEVSGESTPEIVEYFKKNGIKPAMVIDEGGAVVEGVFPGVSKPVAVIGIGEKGMMNVTLTSKGAGGHASTPILPSAIAILGKAANKVEKKGFVPQMTKPVYELFTTVGKHAPLALRIVFANMWLFAPVLKAFSGKLGGEVSAMMRTTTAFTMASGSPQINVLPAQASLGLNLRLINTDTPETAKQRLIDIIADQRVNVEVTKAQKASPYASTQGDNWSRLSGAVAQTWPEAIVSPYLMIACSDSRHYSEICGDVYKFSAMALSKDQRGLIHNNDERIDVETINKCVEFFTNLILKF